MIIMTDIMMMKIIMMKKIITMIFTKMKRKKKKILILKRIMGMYMGEEGKGFFTHSDLDILNQKNVKSAKLKENKMVSNAQKDKDT